MKPYLLLFAIAYCYCCNANCMLTRLSIDERKEKSQLIVQGKIVRQQACWNADKSFIYTVHTLEIQKKLKGNTSGILEIITQGGEIDGKLLVVEPNAALEVGSQGIFFLTPNNTILNYSSSLKKYEIYSAAQGFIEEDNISGKFKDPFAEYSSFNKVSSLILNIPMSNAKYGEDNSTNDNEGSPSVTYFTPTSISAGTQSVLTINGFGFKEKTGAATIQFRNANSVLPNSYITIPDSTYILSWTDTEIKVIVPGTTSGNGGSGSGVFRIIDKNGFPIESETPLTIAYNQFEYKKSKLILVNHNNNGGYTFTLNSDFNANTDAKSSFTRALNQWVCKTGVNATISNTTTTDKCSNQLDNINTVSFASSSCALPAGALAVTYSSYSICDRNSPLFPESIDMIFNPNSSFYFGIGSTPSNQYDFESVALHELGHAFGQGHHSDGTEIMFPSLAQGATKRTLNNNTDISNISDVVNRSTTTTSCIYEKHIKSPNYCTNSTNNTPVTSLFTSDKTKGCAPFMVKFIDQSTGNPTSWKWDISNNGSVEYTTQNPTHTFNQAGTYAIKLVAYNSTTKDSITNTAYITVAPALTVNVEVVQNVSCNNGNNGSLKANASGGDGNYTYSWNNSQNKQLLSNASAGNYTVTVKDGYNCSTNNFKTISQPQPISISIDTETINGNTKNATINVSGGTAPYTYIINNSLELISSIITNIKSGFYNVLIKDKNNCIQNATFSVEAATPTNETESQFEILNVYPNPATDIMNLNFSLKEYKDVKVELYDLSGQTIYYNEYNNVKEQQASVDLSMLSTGTYLLKFGLPEGNTFRKIIVSR